ncbi:WGR domain-containing protein [Rhizobium azibense]|nr:WGR domain-containing protein [Rhizobium azibense]
MSFPLDFAHYALECSDGNRTNKHYNVSLLINPDGMAIIVRRWGKIGKIGDFKIEKFAIQAKAEQEFDKLVQSKLGKGYVSKSSQIKQISSESDLRMAFGPAVWPQIPAGALNHVLPDMDTTGRPAQAAPPRFSEDGRYLGEPPARTYSKTEIAKAREAEKALEQEVAIETYKSNPRFGLF